MPVRRPAPMGTVRGGEERASPPRRRAAHPPLPMVGAVIRGVSRTGGETGENECGRARVPGRGDFGSFFTQPIARRTPNTKHF